MVEAAPVHGFEVRVVSLPGSSPRLPLATRKALGAAASAGAGAVLLDSIVAASTAPWLQLGWRALPLLGIVHQPAGGFERGRLARLILRRLDLAAYRRAARLIVTGEPVAELLCRQGIPAGRLQVVHPGTDHPGRSRPVTDLRRGGRSALLCVANWHRRKGLVAVLEAVGGLPAGYATLHLVGDQEVDRSHSRELWRLLRRPALAERVVVHGVLPPDRVAQMYAAADLFLLPSTDEPYGIVYAEALAAGLPVVGWRSGNLPRLIESGVEGILVEPADVDALRSAVGRLIEDGELRRSMAEGARERATRLPSWEASAAAFFSAISDVLSVRSAD
jgi:glycosyltransferase involved in cell wall biosynthesis